MCSTSGAAESRGICRAPNQHCVLLMPGCLDRSPFFFFQLTFPKICFNMSKYDIYNHVQSARSTR